MAASTDGSREVGWVEVGGLKEWHQRRFRLVLLEIVSQLDIYFRDSAYMLRHARNCPHICIVRAVVILLFGKFHFIFHTHSRRQARAHTHKYTPSRIDKYSFQLEAKQFELML